MTEYEMMKKTSAGWLGCLEDSFQLVLKILRSGTREILVTPQQKELFCQMRQ